MELNKIRDQFLVDPTIKQFRKSPANIEALFAELTEKRARFGDCGIHENISLRKNQADNVNAEFKNIEAKLDRFRSQIELSLKSRRLDEEVR